MLFRAKAQDILDYNKISSRGASVFQRLASNNVRAVAQTADAFVVRQRRSAKFDGRQVQKINVENLNAQIVYALATSADGSLWIGTDKGAARFFDNSFTVLQPTVEKRITTITIWENAVFLGSADTIFKAQTGIENSLYVSIVLQQSLEINTLAGSDKNLLFGSRGRGLITLENGEAKEISSRPRPYFVNILKRDGQNNLWVGAEDKKGTGGLFLANDVFRPERIGGNLGTVTAIGSGVSGDLWIGTEKSGVFRLRNSQILDRFTFENTAGGLRSNKFRHKLTANSRLDRNRPRSQPFDGKVRLKRFRQRDSNLSALLK